MPSEFIKRQKDDFFRDLTALGSLWFYVLIVLFFFIIKDYAIFTKLMTGLVLTYAIVIIIRAFYFKKRPQKYPYISFIEKLDAAAFPSLHAARSTFLAAVLIGHFQNIIISIILVILVLVIAYTRIYLKKHDLKDVSAGVVIGIIVYFAAKFIY